MLDFDVKNVMVCKYGVCLWCVCMVCMFGVYGVYVWCV